MQHVAKDYGKGMDNHSHQPILTTEKEQQEFCINVLRISWNNVRPIVLKHGAQILLAARAFQHHGFDPWWYEFQVVHTPFDVIEKMLVYLKQKKGQKDASTAKMGS